MSDFVLRPTGGALVAGVVGWPVKHSLSPLLHTAWLGAAGVNGVYVPFGVEPDAFYGVARAWGDMGVVGVNVTMPHKAAAFGFADVLSENAQRVQAVNLLVRQGDGRWLGDNTDVVGVVHALRPAMRQLHHVDPHIVGERPAVVFGAGGAGQAVVWALLDLGWKRVVVVNRTREKGERLVDAVQQRLAAGCDVHVECVDWRDRQRALNGAGLIANSTDRGMAGNAPLDVDVSAMVNSCVVFDAVYVPEETPLLRDAAQNERFIVGGLDMFVGQARPSFEAFYGVEAPGQDVVDAPGLIRAALEQKT